MDDGRLRWAIDILLRSTSANPYFVHFGQKNLFCLKWSKRVQMGPKRVPNGQKHLGWLDQFGSFRTLLGPSGPFWTISDKNDFFARNAQSRGWHGCFGAKYQFLFETVQKGPDGPKRVPNGQKHLGWPFWSLSDPFGPHCGPLSGFVQRKLGTPPHPR